MLFKMGLYIVCYVTHVNVLPVFTTYVSDFQSLIFWHRLRDSACVQIYCGIHLVVATLLLSTLMRVCARTRLKQWFDLL